MAFRQSDGSVAWSQNNYGNVYSSPILIDVSGLEQLALVMDGAVIGVNPHNGDLQWQVPFKADYSIAVATAGLGTGQPAVRVVGVQRRLKDDRAQAERTADDRDGAVEFQSVSGCITAMRCALATRSIFRAAARAARRF